ncbi:DsbE family thiol:disulfide interchange protein [Janthinobacterium sp. 17J80-10]|uniref:DsbE family thiol:disulfide interchange protein n=1 Tax=Janthinobacterium sp. 17J80-10 TaxID=2497863 RepID=UPI0010058DFE|nr:DsbE family thiol:disulfide interchange protein [Janthinobacterium sp. 17J80-10]QAU35476.1 DsbE family thiol:disulfide interchange protein [Janthinobacterium sp. 17J80-10]
MRRFLLPFIGFLVLLAFLAIGLRLNPREVPSPLIGKPAPAFVLPQLHAPAETVSARQMAGQVWIFNVWASWCVACRQEHPVLMDLAKTAGVPLVGLNYKDGRDQGAAWLREHGDPYAVSAFDGEGRVGIDYGVYGVPETFVVDKQGIIRLKITGPLTPKDVESRLLPLLRELNRA